MSVWTDMGVVRGRMNGVNPCTFLNTAYGFFQQTREKTRYEKEHSTDWDFLLRRKAGEADSLDWRKWREAGERLTFPAAPEEWGGLARPIPESYWNSVPRWSSILSLNEEALLGEDIIPWPYASQSRPAIMDPAWPRQRYKVIQQMRYMTVPLHIRTKEKKYIPTYPYYTFAWGDYSPQISNPYFINTRYFGWCGKELGGDYRQVEARIPEYWTQRNTVCKIGLEGGWSDVGEAPVAPPGAPPPPINGCYWHNSSTYLSGEYTEEGSYWGTVRLFGAVDLSTHPDFAQFFDINEEEVQ